MGLKLTISIPTWNRLVYLKENVLSIINAITLIPNASVELFVCDNASDDGTEAFMLSQVHDYNFIRYYRHTENKGANVNFYTALKGAHGEYVWLLGDDDKIVEHTLLKLLTDLDHYHPSIVIGGTENDISKQRVYLPHIKTSVLTNETIFSDYDAIQLAGKMSVLIFSTDSLRQVFDSGWTLIQATKTPWPHLVWFFKILALKHSLLILPYATNYFVEKNRYNLLQTGIMRIDLSFADYSTLIKLLHSEFEKHTQCELIKHITKGRVGELVKLLAYSTYLNQYGETLLSAWVTVMALPSWHNKLRFLAYYALPAVLPTKLRYWLFTLPCVFTSPSSAYQQFIHYLCNVKKMPINTRHRNVFNKADL